MKLFLAVAVAALALSALAGANAEFVLDHYPQHSPYVAQDGEVFVQPIESLDALKDAELLEKLAILKAAAAKGEVVTPSGSLLSPSDVTISKPFVANFKGKHCIKVSFIHICI